MSLKINEQRLRDSLSNITFAQHGDKYEQKYGHYLKDTFPNCEVFWRNVVVPMTLRVELRADQSPIDPRTSIDPRIEELSGLHYTLFTHLVFARFHLDPNVPDWLEIVFSHLVSACDLAEKLVEKWHILSLECKGRKSDALNKLTKEELQGRVDEWYSNYIGLHKSYLETGIPITLSINLGTALVTEYFGAEHETMRKDHKKIVRPIRNRRNQMIHNLKVAMIEEPSGEILIPKTSKMDHYKTWRSVREAARNPDKTKSDFIDARQQAKDDLDALEKSLNRFWEILLEDFDKEFYSSERKTLQNMYDIEFDRAATSDEAMFGVSNNDHGVPHSDIIPGSGRFEGVNVSNVADTAGSTVFIRCM